MESYKCPVCGKTGIPNYFTENVVCPNCNSDLGVYKTLHSIEADKISTEKNVRHYKLLSIVLPILAVLLIGTLAFIYNHREVKDYKQQIIYTNSVVTQLRDSIDTLLIQSEKQKSMDEKSDDHFIEYTILPNDSPWGIVHKFYGKRNDWKSIVKKIGADNGIWDEEAETWKQIHPGQTIKIYNLK